MHSQRNKYVWVKHGQTRSSECSNKALKSPSKYKFRRNKLISHEVESSTSIVPSTLCDTSQRAYRINSPSVCGYPRPHTRSATMKVLNDSRSRYKYCKTDETEHAQLTVSRYTSSSISRTCAKRTLYKYVKGRCSGIGPKLQKEKLAVRKRQPNIARNSQYKYVRKRISNSTSRIGVAANMRAIHSTKCGVSHLCALSATSNLQKSLKFRRKPMCTSYIMNGMCDAGSDCSLEHDENYIRICPRYLHHRCALGRFLCPLAHVLDPCRLPVCEFFIKSDCNRVNCPYIHTSRSPDTPICPLFQRGRCPMGRTCSKLHVWLTKNGRKNDTSKRKRFSATPYRSALSSSSHGQEDRSEPLEPPSSTSDAPLFISLAIPATPVPEGSLRNVFPPPNYIPLLEDD